MRPIFKDGDKEFPLEIVSERLSEDGTQIIVTVRVPPEVLDEVKVGDKVETYFSLPK